MKEGETIIRIRVSGTPTINTLDLTAIDEDGNVRDVEILKDLPMGLGSKAVEAVRKWKFQPATQDGVPIAVDHNLSVSFRLN